MSEIEPALTSTSVIYTPWVIKVRVLFLIFLMTTVRDYNKYFNYSKTNPVFDDEGYLKHVKASPNGLVSSFIHSKTFTRFLMVEICEEVHL